MPISLKTLQALAACNPFRWDGLNQDELDARIEAAGLTRHLPFRASPDRPYRTKIGKTTATYAVLDRWAQEDPEEAEQLRQYQWSNGEGKGELAIFDLIDRMVVERKREALVAIAGQRLPGAVARRAM